MNLNTDFQSPKNLQKSHYDYDIGVLLFRNGNFSKSLPYLKRSMDFFKNEKSFKEYLLCYNLIVQILNELDQKKELNELQKEVESYSDYYSISNKARFLCSLAYYNLHTEKKLKQAKNNLDEALKTIFSIYDKKSEDKILNLSLRMEILICLTTYSYYYFNNKEYEKCKKEIKNITILLEDLSKLKINIEDARSKTENIQKLQEYNELLESLSFYSTYIRGVEISIKYIESHLERVFGNYEKSIKILWELYETSNKKNYNLIIPYIFINMAYNYKDLKDKIQAKVFVDLAEKYVIEDRKILIQHINTFKQNLKFDSSKDQSYDIIFDHVEHTIVEKNKGCIELKNQFILLDLLKLFLTNQGVSYSKEDIMKKIWKQKYQPEIHDNKIYVTIKRLREIIEVNSCNPKYLCRSQIGYYFSKQAKILIKEGGSHV